MKVKIDINRLDYWNLNKYCMINNPKLKRTFLTTMIALPVFMFLLLVILRNDQSRPILPLIVVALIGGVLADLLVVFLTKKKVMSFPAEKPGMLGEHIIEINHIGVIEKTEVNEGFHSWKAFQSIVQDKSYIFLIIDSLAAHIIPKRSFISDQEAEAFFHTACEYWNQNKIV